MVLTGRASEILEKFHKMNARVVFSAEGFCWPDKGLAVSSIDQGPVVRNKRGC